MRGISWGGSGGQAPGRPFGNGASSPVFTFFRVLDGTGAYSDQPDHRFRGMAITLGWAKRSVEMLGESSPCS